MNVDLAFAQLRAANPVPEAGSLSLQTNGAPAASEWREASMPIEQSEDRLDRPEEEQQRPRAWKAPLLVAAVAALVVTVAVILLSGGDGSEFAEPNSLAPEEVALAFLAARGADEERYWALIADDATLPLGMAVTSQSGSEFLRDMFDTMQAMNARTVDVSCDLTGETHERSGGAIVNCAGWYEDAVQDALGVNRVGMTASYAVRDSQIVHFGETNVENQDVVEFVDDYMAENHLDEMVAACWGPDATGKTCSAHRLEYLPELADAWQARDTG